MSLISFADALLEQEAKVRMIELTHIEAKLENLYLTFQKQENIVISIKEDISDLAAEWFSQNDLDCNLTINDIQKKMLDSVLSPIKIVEKIAMTNIAKTTTKIRNASRHLHMKKGLGPLTDDMALYMYKECYEHHED